MTIKVRYFASVRERVGRSEDDLAVSGALSVEEVWSRATGLPRPARLLAAINHEHAGFERLAQAGDEVAFFPPVTGGAR